jgi:hypothetical protein
MSVSATLTNSFAYKTVIVYKCDASILAMDPCIHTLCTYACCICATYGTKYSIYLLTYRRTPPVTSLASRDTAFVTTRLKKNLVKKKTLNSKQVLQSVIYSSKVTASGSRASVTSLTWNGHETKKRTRSPHDASSGTEKSTIIHYGITNVSKVKPLRKSKQLDCICMYSCKCYEIYESHNAIDRFGVYNWGYNLPVYIHVNYTRDCWIAIKTQKKTKKWHSFKAHTSYRQASRIVRGNSLKHQRDRPRW